MADRARLDCSYHLIRYAEDCVVPKAGGNLLAAVDAGESGILGVAAKGQGLFDHGREIPRLADVDKAGEGHHAGGEDPIRIALFGGHEAIGGKEHSAGDIGKFLLLVLPGRAKVALEVGIGLKLGIGVGGQHFAVGIDVDALILGLLEQQLQVQQVVPADHDEGTLLHGERHGGGRGRAVGFRIGSVEQGHTFQVDLAHLEHQGQQLRHAPILADGAQGLVEEGVHSLVRIAQHQGVFGIGGHAAQAEKDQGFEGAHILVALPYQVQVVICAAAQGLLFALDHPDVPRERLVVEADVGHGHEEALDHGLVGRGAGLGVLGRPRQADHRAGEFILHAGGGGFFATDPRFPLAADLARRLFALETKHLLRHGFSSCLFYF